VLRCYAEQPILTVTSQSCGSLVEETGLSFLFQFGGMFFCQNKQCIIHVSQLTSANIPRYGLLPLLTLGRKKSEDKSSHITRKLHNKVMYISHNKNHHRCTFTYLRFTAFLLNYIFFHVMTEVLESNCLQPKFLKCSCFLSATCWLFSRTIT